MFITFPVVSPSSVLSPQTWPFGLEWLPRPAYLVGGIVRDALLGRQTSQLDLDFVMPTDAVETARAIARHHKAGFVLLDAERQIARVVFDGATADFAQQVGPTLEIDLQRRDFTVNAIAYNPHQNELIDPLQGHQDLNQGLLRMISIENLEEDPLRLLRAYRQAAQLGFQLDDQTQAAICKLAPSLGRVAAERVQAELSYLFGTPRGTRWLMTAWQDGLLQSWFPSTTLSSLKLLAAIEPAALLLSEANPTFGHELSRWVREKPTHATTPNGKAGLTPTAPAKLGSGRRTWLATAKLASFFTSAPEWAEPEMLRLKYSRVEIQAVMTVLKFLPQLRSAAAELSRREQYFLFRGVDTAFPALVVLAVAAGAPIEAVTPLIDRFLNPQDPIAHPTPLLTGQDLMTELQLPAGPRIGKLLAAIQLARAEEQVTTATEALAFARQWIQQGN